MCLQGGEQVDISRYVDPAAGRLELKVTMEPATGTLLVYSPGYEDRPARMSGAESIAWIPFAQPVICLKAIGGPFDFNIKIMPIDRPHHPSGTSATLIKPSGWGRPIGGIPSVRINEDKKAAPPTEAQTRELAWPTQA
jgi:hypothetical protein